MRQTTEIKARKCRPFSSIFVLEVCVTSVIFSVLDYWWPNFLIVLSKRDESFKGSGSIRNERF